MHLEKALQPTDMPLLLGTAQHAILQCCRQLEALSPANRRLKRLTRPSSVTTVEVLPWKKGWLPLQISTAEAGWERDASERSSPW